MEIKVKKILKCTTLVVMFNTYEMHQEEMNILNHLKKRDKEFESLAEVVYCYSEGMELKKERILFYKRNELKKICYSVEYVRDTKELILYYPYESNYYTRYNSDRGVFKKYKVYEIALVLNQIKKFEREGICE